MTLHLPPGTVIGQYRLEAMHAQGGFGVVYRARHIHLDRPVAVKMIRPEYAHEDEHRERFLREAKRAASLDHPGILSATDYGTWQEQLYMAMRFVDGCDLGARIKREGRLDPQLVIRIVEQLADALDHAHERGLVHLDVKPENILLEPAHGDRPRVLLTDFGLARAVLSDTNLTRLTRAGQLPGTLDYMSPERFKDDPVDRRSDVYALGCVLVKALTGAVPYERSRPEAVMMAHLTADPPVPSLLITSLPTAIDDVVRRSLAKEPADRQASAGELSRATTRAISVAKPLSPPPPSPRPPSQDEAVPMPSWVPPKPLPPAPLPDHAPTTPGQQIARGMILGVLLAPAVAFFAALITWVDAAAGPVTLYNWAEHRTLAGIGALLGGAQAAALCLAAPTRLPRVIAIGSAAAAGAVAGLAGGLVAGDSTLSTQLMVTFGALGLGAGLGVALVVESGVAAFGAVLAGSVAGMLGGYLLSLAGEYPESALDLAARAAGPPALAAIGIGLVVAAFSKRM